MYTPIERKPRVSQPLVIPRALQSALPYVDRPKVRKANHQPGTIAAVQAQRPAVVLEPREQKVAKLMAMLKTRYQDRSERLHVEAVQRLSAHRAVVRAEVARKVETHFLSFFDFDANNICLICLRWKNKRKLASPSLDYWAELRLSKKPKHEEEVAEKTEGAEGGVEVVEGGGSVWK